MFGTRLDHYQPVQLYHLNQKGVRCRLIKPDARLANEIYYYWILELSAGRIDLEVIPDIAVDLVMSPEIPRFSALYFPAAEKFTIPLEGPVAYTGICCQFARVDSLFGYSIAQLKSIEAGNQTTATLQIEPLVAELQEQNQSQSIKELFDSYFLQRGHYGAQATKDNSVSALRYLIEFAPPDRLQSVARHVGLSERQLRRVTTSLFGFSPKKIQRILRLQLALQEIFNSTAAQSRADYYDDSHKIREIKELTGLTPGEIQNMAEKYNHQK